MFRSTSTGFNKYDTSEQTSRTHKKWEDENMYKTSYFKISEKNVIYLSNNLRIALRNEKFN
jgi:hypothetical protein